MENEKIKVIFNGELYFKDLKLAIKLVNSFNKELAKMVRNSVEFHNLKGATFIGEDGREIQYRSKKEIKHLKEIGVIIPKITTKI